MLVSFLQDKNEKSLLSRRPVTSDNCTEITVRNVREGSFNPCSSMVYTLKLLCLLAHTSRLQEFMAFLREAQRHASTRLLCISAFFP